MRIIAGQLGGRQFEAPAGHRTHPMSEKMRGALFNALGDIDGLHVLDAYAGSGALAFEALSRGADKAQLIEKDKTAAQTIQTNIAQLGLETSAHLTMANITGWSQRNPLLKFDLILADPPYDHLSAGAIQQLSQHVSAGGLLVLSWPPNETLPELETLNLLDRKSYGDSQLVFYRQIQ